MNDENEKKLLLSPNKKSSLSGKSRYIEEWKEFNNNNNNNQQNARIIEHWSHDLKVDNITIPYLYNSHRITALLLVIFILIISLLYHDSEQSNTLTNVRFSVKLTITIFLILCTMTLPNGPFIRPHPHIWRMALGIGILYEMFLVFILFNSTNDSRQFMKFFEDDLGVPLKERSYASNCEFTLNNIYNNIDRFVIAHFLGWVAKILVIRSRLLCWMLSISWEIVEVIFTSWQPNFAECWWDQILLDIIIANGAGIHLGYYLANWLEVHQYDKWHGIKDYPSLTGKAKRIAMQFTPERWTSIKWNHITGWRLFFCANAVVWGFLLQEFNAFILKTIFWIPPKSPLNIYRLAIYFFLGLPALKQFYTYASDPTCKRIGAHLWVVLSFLATEVLVIIRHGAHIYTIEFPSNSKIGGVIFIIAYFSIASFLLLNYKNKRKNK